MNYTTELSTDELMSQIRETKSGYHSLLVKVIKSTDQLINTTGSATVSEIRRMMRIHNDFCHKIEGYTSKLGSLLRTAGDRVEVVDASGISRELSLKDYMYDTDELHKFLRKKQTECQEAISKRSEICRMELMGFRRRRSMDTVYNSANYTRSPKFLDKKT
jgi:hypothetical protein